VVCSGAIAYQGPFTAPYRAKLNAAWVAKVKGLGIDCADNPTVGNVLGDPVTVSLPSSLYIPIYRYRYRYG